MVVQFMYKKCEIPVVAKALILDVCILKPQGYLLVDDIRGNHGSFGRRRVAGPPEEVLTPSFIGTAKGGRLVAELIVISFGCIKQLAMGSCSTRVGSRHGVYFLE